MTDIGAFDVVYGDFKNQQISLAEDSTSFNIFQASESAIDFELTNPSILKPDAFIPRVLTIADYSTIVDVRVSFGGRAYLTAPQLVIFDKFFCEKVIRFPEPEIK